MPQKPLRKRSRFRRPRKSPFGLLCAATIVLILAVYFALASYANPHVGGDRLRYDEFVQAARDGRLQSAVLLDVDSYVIGRYQAPDGAIRAYNTPYLKNDSARDRLIDLLEQNQVATEIRQQNLKGFFNNQATLLTSGLIGATLLIYFVVSMRRGEGLFATSSGARRFRSKDAKVTFADVAGQETAVTELSEISQFLTDPKRYTDVGARIPKGVLLYGPPGCGKTLMARALAGEAGAEFFSISGSDFLEIFVGVGAARVRDLFKEARRHAPAIVFIDELDSIGRTRGNAKSAGAQSEQEQALNQILFEMDGFSPLEGIVVVGATNRPDVLDRALLRPGRFDRSVGLERPDEKGRLEILKIHAKGKRLAPGADLARVAKKAIGLTGADLASLMNEAALLAGRARAAAIASPHLEQALQRILAEPDRQRRLSMRDRQVSHRYSSGDERVTFADVGGVDEVVEELAELRDYLADPERYARAGASVPRGILLDGQPGCGKTLLARALAGEANAAFLYVAATEFVEVYVGEGAARVRNLFAEAASVAPAIVFIDEIDAIGARRPTSTVEGNRESEHTLNQILVELDGFSPRTGVIVIGATNRADILDPALVRSGRFDMRITLSTPSRDRRREILAIHARGKALAADVDLDKVAALTSGFSGAALAGVISQAVMLGLRRGLDQIPMDVVEEAIERQARGVAPITRMFDEGERRMAAYHEMGHALVGLALPGANPPHRITIIPRGDALGDTWNLSSLRLVRSRSMMLDEMAALLGGRAAEELVFGEPASGAADDLHRVSEVARRMVCELGMSEMLEPFAINGQGVGGLPPVYSDDTVRIVDSEIRKMVAEAHRRARAVLSANRDVLDAGARILLEREVLTGEELNAMVPGSGLGEGPAATAATRVARTRRQ